MGRIIVETVLESGTVVGMANLVRVHGHKSSGTYLREESAESSKGCGGREMEFVMGSLGK